MSQALTPHEWAAKGKSAYGDKDYSIAAAAYARAKDGYLFLGDTLAAAEMANNQGVALLQKGDPNQAIAVLAGTDLIFAQAGDVRRQAMAIGNQASALEAQNKLDAAALAYQKSAELLEELGEADLRATVMQSLSAVQLRLGKQLDAVLSMQSGLDAVKRPNIRQRIARKLLKTPFKLINNL